jgi:hypothetical protein
MIAAITQNPEVINAMIYIERYRKKEAISVGPF